MAKKKSQKVQPSLAEEKYHTLLIAVKEVGSQIAAKAKEADQANITTGAAVQLARKDAFMEAKGLLDSAVVNS